MKQSAKWTGKLIGGAVAAVIVLGLIFLPGLWQDNAPLQAASPTEEEPLRICFDLGIADNGTLPQEVKVVVNSFLSRMEQATGLKNYEVEVIPSSGMERQAELEQLRTEILAGGGPDVFILETEGWGEEECLFQYPERAMADGVFYDLTQLLKEAEYLEPEKLTTTVLDGGKVGGRQVALPITYSFWGTVYKQEDVPPPQQAMTWTECAQNGDPAYAYAAGCGVDLFGDSFPADIFGNLADYQKGKLSFSQQELEELLFSLFESRETIDFDALPMNLIGNLGFDYSDDLGLFSAAGLELSELAGEDGVVHASAMFKTGLVGGNDHYGAPTEDLTYLPLFNRDGGVTAKVNCWTAVNANSRYPRDAFTVLDYLLSEEEQMRLNGQDRNASIYSLEVRFPSFSLWEQAGSEASSIDSWWITDKSFESLSWVREQINRVRFPDPMEQTLYLLLAYCSQVYEDDPHGDWQEAMKPLISEAYQELETMLAES